ncbi:molybdate ABC transporter substrate-binding protein [Shewanella sp. NFH-SH190041]|uniref:molybdate ABC transporter substrate-binding protein n=1 Tax=Shewanella sp. NFH-SH190041 TaxID=2950245 RepID=UPI003965BA19
MLRRSLRLSLLPLTLCLMLLALLLPQPVRAAEIPVIAAASNIKFALDDIAKLFYQQTGQRVRISYGSSGNFVAQIRHGAPFELFLSADVRYIHQLQQLKLVQGSPVLYAVGRLALVAPKHGTLQLTPDLSGVKALLQQGQLKRFAIANPEHAPYGERAQEYLQHFGLWQDIKPHLIYGENVSQAAQFAISGSTAGGIVALSLVKAPQFAARANYIALPQVLHGPLDQDMVLLPKAGPVAKAFFRFILSEPARQIFTRYGFGLPAAPAIEGSTAPLSTELQSQVSQP